MMVNRVSALLVAFAALAAGEEWEYEDNVAVLDETNFDAFIASQEYTIIEFYAPWCGHCKSLAPEWAAAAGKTRRLNPSTILAKVDADAHKKLSDRYEIGGYPTIKIFKNGEPQDYTGPRESKGIVGFVKKAMGITGSGNLEKLKTADEAQKLTAGYALIGLFREPVKASAMFGVFAEVASELPSYTDKPLKAAYGANYGTDPVATSLGIKTVPAILLYRPGGEPVSMPIPRKRDEFTEDALVAWIQKNV